MRFDHFLSWVPHREQAVAVYKEHGLHVVIGGEHPDWGSHNALSHFGLQYIELIAVADREKAVHAPQYNARERERLIARGGGALTFVVAVPDLAAAVATLRQRGLDVEEPERGRRIRPDGSVVGWQTAAIRTGPQWRPFLIQWDQPDPERLADLRERGIDAVHPSGARQMKRLEIASLDPAGDAAWCSTLVGAPASAVEGGWMVPLEGCQLLFLPPAAAGVADADAPLLARLVLEGDRSQRWNLNGLQVEVEQRP